MTGETDHELYRLETAEHRCPRCGHKGFCDVSPHVFFLLDRFAIRCRQCKNVWPDRPLPNLAYDRMVHPDELSDLPR